MNELQFRAGSSAGFKLLGNNDAAARQGIAGSERARRGVANPRFRKWAAAVSILLLTGVAITFGAIWKKGLLASWGATPTEEMAILKAAKVFSGAKPGLDSGCQVTFNDGVERTLDFPSPARDAVVGEFWPGKSSLAVGFHGVGPWGGKLLIFDAVECQKSLHPKPEFELRVCTPPPSAWDFQEHGMICHVSAELAADLDDVPGDELVVASCHDDGACELLVLGPPDRKIGSFWHYGWIEGVQAIDLDDDGEKELICRGVANWRESSAPHGTMSEPLHSCILILQLESLDSGIGYGDRTPGWAEVRK